MVTSSGDAGGPVRVFMRVVKEPLVHFLLVGVVLWVASSHYRAAHDDYRIVVTAQTIERIKADYRAEYGSDPAPGRLRNLVNAYVDGEILYREGQARGLAADDEIVRRRIIQKTAFMIEGVDTPAPPSDDVLRAWYDARAESYASQGKVSFTHVFFAAEPGTEQQSRKRALAVLDGLKPGTLRAPVRGDPFPDLSDFTDFTSADARRLFGTSAMATALFAAPVGTWAGPFRSAYGWHLVRVSSAQAGRPQPFERVRDQVREDWIEQARKDANARHLAEIRARYTVVGADI